MSDSVRPYGQQPTRLLCPRDSPGRNTGVGCHFLLQVLVYYSLKLSISKKYLWLNLGPWTLIYEKKLAINDTLEKPLSQHFLQNTLRATVKVWQPHWNTEDNWQVFVHVYFFSPRLQSLSSSLLLLLTHQYLPVYFTLVSLPSKIAHVYLLP